MGMEIALPVPVLSSFVLAYVTTPPPPDTLSKMELRI